MNEEVIELVKPELVEYVKTEIFPRYDAMEGHDSSHIKNVINRSISFAKRINEKDIKTTPKDFENLPSSLPQDRIDYNLSFTIAAFHDLGREKNDKLHHLLSAALLLEDDFILQNFTRDELRIMADAIMDHRASNELDPITIYGKIVSSADRDTDVEEMFRRAALYFRHLYPEASDDETVDRACEKLYKKFVGESAYAAKKMYFENPDYEKALETYNRLAANPDDFHAAVKKAMQDAIENQSK